MFAKAVMLNQVVYSLNHVECSLKLVACPLSHMECLPVDTFRSASCANLFAKVAMRTVTKEVRQTSLQSTALSKLSLN
jgi:hypothetical protein